MSLTGIPASDLTLLDPLNSTDGVVVFRPGSPTPLQRATVAELSAMLVPAGVLSLNAYGGCAGADDTALLLSLDALIGATPGLTSISGVGTCLTSGVTLVHASLWSQPGNLTFSLFGNATLGALVVLGGQGQTVIGVNASLPVQPAINGPIAAANSIIAFQWKRADGAIQHNIAARDIYSLGGRGAVDFYNCTDPFIDNVFAENAFLHGGAFVSGTNNGPSGRIRVTRFRARNCGQYGFTLGGTRLAGPTTTDVYIDGLISDSCGMLDPTNANLKLGFDTNVGNAQKVYISAQVYNCGGGTELKRGSGAPVPDSVTPTGLYDFQVNLRLVTCVDFNWGLSIAYEAPPTALLPNEEQGIDGNVITTYRPADPWQPDYPYNLGDFVNCDGQLWWCLQSGTSGNIAGVSSNAPMIVNGGSAYTNGDVLTPVGGVHTSLGTFTATVSGGIVTALTPSGTWAYTAPPAGYGASPPAAVVAFTGGTGTLCTALVNWSGPLGANAVATLFGVPDTAYFDIVAVGGSLNQVGDVLTVPGGTFTGPQPTITVTAVDGGGAITAWTANGAGATVCTAYPTNPVTLNNLHGGTQAQINIGWSHLAVTDGTVNWSKRFAFAATSQTLTATNIEACTDVHMNVEANNTAFLNLHGPRGSSDQSCRSITFSNPRGYNLTKAGFATQAPQYGGSFTVDQFRILNPDIHVTGASGKALSLAVPGYIYTNFELLGGVLEGTGANSFAVFINGQTSGSFTGRIGGDIQLRGTSAAVSLTSTSNTIALTLSSVTQEIVGAGAGSAVLFTSGAGTTVTGNGANQLLGAPANFRGYSITGGSVVTGLYCRGSTVAIPTLAGSVGEFFFATAPNATQTGWRCTTAGNAGAATWTPFL